MQLHGLMLNLCHPFQDLLCPEGKPRNKTSRIVQEKNGFTQGPGKSTKKMLRVETEVYKAKGGTLFLLYMVGFTACQKTDQSWCDFRTQQS